MIKYELGLLAAEVDKVRVFCVLMPLALSQKCGGHPSLTLPGHETRLIVSQMAVEVGSQPFDGQLY